MGIVRSKENPVGKDTAIMGNCYLHFTGGGN